MRWRMVLLAAFALSAPVRMEKEPEKPTEIEIVNETGERVKDRILGLYEDEEFTKPYTDKDGKAVMISADEKGTYAVPVRKEVCYVKSEPVTGYYPVIAAVHKGKGGSLMQYAVQAEIEVVCPEEEEEMILEMTDEEDHVVTAWKSTEKFTDSGKLDAGRTYHVRIKEPVPFRTVCDGELMVPETKPETLRKEMRIVRYGEVKFLTEKETEAEYALYTNRECTEKALDVSGKEVTVRAGEKMAAALLPQTYYVRQTAVSDAWYIRKEPEELVVKKEETSEYALTEENVHAVISADTDCTVHIRRQEGEEEVLDLSAGSESEVSGRRNETITVHTDACADHFPCEDVSYTFAETAEEEKGISVSLRPFTAAVSVIDSSGNLLAGGRIKVTDRKGKEVFAGLSREEQLIVSGLQAGNTYTVMLEGTAGHYYPVSTRELRIPAVYAEESGDAFAASIECRPFTDVSLSEGSGALYRDEACAEEAADIYGSAVILSEEPRRLAEGIYWLMPEAREGYYPAGKAVKVEVSGEAQLTVSGGMEPVELSVTAVDDQNEPVPGAVIQLLDETREKILAQKILAEGPAVFGPDVMRAANTYYVRQIAAADHYLKETEDYAVTVPEYRENDLQVTLRNRHYSTLILHIYPDLQTPDEHWTVYREDGSPAQDIYHNAAEFHLNDREEAVLQLPAGTYVLKQTQCTPGVYPDDEEIRAEIGAEDVYEISRQNTSTALFVRIETEDGAALSGLVMEAVGADGTVYDTWNAETHEHRIDGIPAEAAVILRAKQLPYGYELQEKEYRTVMPASVPDAAPVTEILLVNKPLRTILPKHIAEKDVPPTLPWGILTGAGSLVLMGIRFLLRRTQRL